MRWPKIIFDDNNIHLVVFHRYDTFQTGAGSLLYLFRSTCRYGKKAFEIRGTENAKGPLSLLARSLGFGIIN